MKQVIVMRKDLNMRKGKMVAQGAHASIAFLCEHYRLGTLPNQLEQMWLSGPFKKICVGVNSEAELLAIHMEAVWAGIKSFVIEDSGLTEFKGVPTNTCLCLGPDKSEVLDRITGGLTLL